MNRPCIQSRAGWGVRLAALLAALTLSALVVADLGAQTKAKAGRSKSQETLTPDGVERGGVVNPNDPENVDLNSLETTDDSNVQDITKRRKKALEDWNYHLPGSKRIE